MKKSKKINLGIIGAGAMSNEYLKVIKDLKNVNCSTIYSRTFSKAEILKKKYKIKKNCNSIDEFKESRTLDAVIVAVNEHSTFSILKKIYKLKCPKLFEKPLGYNYKQSELIKKFINKNNVKNVYVALNRRFYSSTLKAKDLIKRVNGKRFIKINDQQVQKYNNFVNENMMYGNSIHLIDYIANFTRGNLYKINKIKKFKSKKFDEVVCKLSFKSGDEVLYYCNWNSPGNWSVSITQKNQRCEMKPLENLNYQKLDNFKKIKRISFEFDKFEKKYKAGFYNMIKEFLKTIRKKNHKITEFKEYLKTVEYIKKIYD